FAARILAAVRQKIHSSYCPNLRGQLCGEQEGFLEASMLASSRSDPGPLPTADFTFDWTFTGKDQPPEAAISESGLRSTFEAQARLIYMSDPIPIESLA
ncbi:hypothetical protein, partial [Bradyrhizobium diazoefficiens]